MDFNSINSFNNTIANIKIPELVLPEYEDTVCGKMDRLEENIKKSNLTQESQLVELEKIRYENIKLNAQIDTLNKLTDKQSDDILELKNDLATTKKSLKDFKAQYNNSNKHSLIKGIIIGFIPSLIIFLLTLLATNYGLL